MSEWLKWLLLGILSMVFGVYVLGNTVVASLAVTSLVGVLLLVSGGFQIVAGFTAQGFASTVFAVLMGVLMALLGWSFLSNPFEGAISLTLLVLILLLASGILRVIFALRMRGTQFLIPMLVSGALSILLAGYVWMNFDTAGPQFIGILLGIEMLFNGAGLIFMAFFVRTAEKELVG